MVTVMATNIMPKNARNRDAALFNANNQFGRNFMTDRALSYIAYAHLGMIAIGGAARYYLGLVGLLPLAYATNALVVVAVVLWLVISIGCLRIQKFEFVMIVSLTLSFGVAVCSNGKIMAVVFGVYLFTPFMLGVFSSRELLERLIDDSRFMLAIWVITLIGISWDKITAVPWSGFAFDVGNVQVAGSRDWSFEGVRRVAGFARSSFDASGFLLVSAICILSKNRKSSLFWILWLFTGIGIGMTTSKGMLLAYALNSVVWLWMRTKARTWLAMLPIAVVLVLITMPMLPLITQFELIRPGDISSSVFGSFFVRLVYTWPEAWELLFKAGNFISGAGVGSIGTPLMLFDPNSYNSADNVFVYGVFIFGIAWLPFLVGFSIRAASNAKYVGVSPLSTLCFQMSLAVLVYGITTNVVELGPMSLVFGALSRRYFSTDRVHYSYSNNVLGLSERSSI
jgi:hypothetical protein